MSIFTEITNPFINNRNQIKNTDGKWIDMQEERHIQKRSTQLRLKPENGVTYNVFTSFNRPVYLEMFEMGGVINGCYPLLFLSSGEDGSYQSIFHVIRFDGRANPTPSMLRESLSEHLETKQSSSDDTQNIITLKKPIFLPEGCKLAIRSLSTVEQEVTYKAFWREIL